VNGTDDFYRQQSAAQLAMKQQHRGEDFACTAAERELLDALNANPKANLQDLRARLAISKIPAATKERFIATWAELMKWSEAHQEATKEMETLGAWASLGKARYSYGETSSGAGRGASEELWDECEAEAKRRAGIEDG